MFALVRLSAYAALTVLLGGCYNVPIRETRTALPDISPVLPADIRSGNRDVMVIMRTPAKNIHTPAFAKPETLDALMRETTYATSGFGVVMLFPWVPIYAGSHDANVSTIINSICVFTADGKLIKFDLSAKTWNLSNRAQLTLARRDALVAALRADNATAFAPYTQVAGPCDIEGRIEWPATQRTRAIEFLTRISATDPAKPDPRLDEILKRAGPNHAHAVGGGAMLSIMANWRSDESSAKLPNMANRSPQDGAAPPLFFSNADFQEFRKLAASMKESDFEALIASKVPEALTWRDFREIRACAIGSDGGALAWIDGDSISTQTGPASRPRGWREIVVGRMEVGAYSRDTRCFPFWPRSWSEKETAEVGAFLNALPIRPMKPDPPPDKLPDPVAAYGRTRVAASAPDDIASAPRPVRPRHGS
jgi:hypothetical protein